MGDHRGSYDAKKRWPAYWNSTFLAKLSTQQLSAPPAVISETKTRHIKQSIFLNIHAKHLLSILLCEEWSEKTADVCWASLVILKFLLNII